MNSGKFMNLTRWWIEMNNYYQVRQDFCKYLIKTIGSKMAGNSIDENYCLYNRPRDVYPLGSLSPCGIPKAEEDDFMTDYLAKYAPYSVGMEFLVKEDTDAKIIITMGANVYYRVYPTYEQQMNLGSKDMAVVFKRISTEGIILTIHYNELMENGTLSLKYENSPEIQSAFEKIYQKIENDSETICDADYSSCFNTMITEEEFHSILFEKSTGRKVIPNWEIELKISRNKTIKGPDELQILMINMSTDVDPFGETKLYDNYIFDAKFKVTTIGTNITPYKFNLLEESYRYKRDMWGVGINCTVVPDQQGLKTEAMPIYEQKRYGSRKILPNKEEIQKLRFSDLSKTPIPILQQLKNHMTNYKEYCLQNPQELIDTYSLLGTENELLKYTENMNYFQIEIDRFQAGIDILIKAQNERSKYHIVYRAFIMMNETFDFLSRKKNYDSWRTFQIVFIVSHLLDIIGQHWVDDFKDNNNIEKITVLWFPTGGGKTEAYLGLVVFNLFFDRLRGKLDGMTVLFRFPLRILSFQQFQRIYETLNAAAHIKEEHGLNGKNFSIGHWVGNDQTPNKIDNKNWLAAIDILKNHSVKDEDYQEIQQKLKRVHKCLECGKTSIEVVWNEKRGTILHYCNICKKYLPIYIVDTDIYNYLPSIVVSTVDKIAVAGQQKNFANILGDVRYYSPTKGYSWRYEKDWSDGQVVSEENRKLLKPTLQVQDELHLLKEDLGAYDSHYETMIQKILRDISGNYPWKIIASTATIQDFNRHVSHLYGKETGLHKSIRFPQEGPKCDESFYNVGDDDGSIGRFYTGIMGHNKTHINTIVDVIHNFHKTIRQIRKMNLEDFKNKTGIILSDFEKNRLVDDYEVGLNYVLTKRNADQIAESIGSQIADYLNESDLSGIRNEMLTGGTTPERLSQVMELVQYEYSDLSPDDRITSITATSMISHGVDVERFNFITFFGIPRQTAEYIQASSRVGRTVPGISIVVFAPQKERDQSYYKYFVKYHEYLDRLVEPPAINRWSKFSIDKTFPGILFGIILDRFNRETGKDFQKPDILKEYIITKDFRTRQKLEQELYEILISSYVSNQPYGEVFTLKIKENVNIFFEGLRKNRNKWMKDFLTTIYGSDPMMSLRDTEEEIGFYKTFSLQNRKIRL